MNRLPVWIPKARRDFWEEIHQLAAGGLTVMITTHYMDEASRCHRLAYIAYGNLLARGTVDEVIKTAALTTWEVAATPSGAGDKIPRSSGRGTGHAFDDAARERARCRRKCARASAPFMNRAGYRWTKIEAGLEDVFISLMDTARDNFS